MPPPPKHSTSTIIQTPLIEETRLKEILKNVYGISECNIFNLTGYDDLNFRIENVVFNSNANETLKNRGEKVFIVKFTNPLESEIPDLIDGQIKLTEHLRNHGIPCFETFPTIDGSLWKFVYMTDSVKAPIRLIQFMPGIMLENIGYNNIVFELIGSLVADFHNATSTFIHPAYKKQGGSHFMWGECWEALEEEFNYQVLEGHLIDEKQIKLCQKGFEDLRNDILSKRHKFQSGLIHSDINETNVLLLRKNSSSQHESYEITALLDFGDVHHSLLIYDIAALVLYLSVDTKEDNWRIIARQVIKGYEKKRKLAAFDLEHILVSIRAKLISSLIYAMRTVRINYRNEEDPTYILKMQDYGWKILELFTNEYDSNNRLI